MLFYKDSTSKSPFPVATSIVIAVANPTIAKRPSHTSKPLLPLAPCSHLMGTDGARFSSFLFLDAAQKTADKAIIN